MATSTENFKTMITEVLRKGYHEIVFEKLNGEQRSMKATIDAELIPNENTTEKKREKKKNPDICEVYDIEAKGWRSFRWDNLKKLNGVVVG